MKLANQSAIVTGGDSGIGRAIALEFARQGADVLVNYNSDAEGAAEVADMIRDMGPLAVPFQANVADEQAVISMFNEARSQFGTIDILVNNAGMQKDAPFHEMTLADWQKVIDVNLTGQFLCAREAVREFFRRGMAEDRSKALGKILCMSSVHDIIPWAGHVNYATSKGGILMLVKSMAQELAAKKIRVVGISPGAIRTKINKDAWDDQESMTDLLKLIPYGRIGEPDDVGRLAAWLASDEADYITGTTVYVDGGMTLYPGFEDNG
jgi:glucose 1-dehydrogenase